jgi:hypothetical protein
MAGLLSSNVSLSISYLGIAFGGGESLTSNRVSQTSTTEVKPHPGTALPEMLIQAREHATCGTDFNYKEVCCIARAHRWDSSHPVTICRGSAFLTNSQAWWTEAWDHLEGVILPPMRVVQPVSPKEFREEVFSDVFALDQPGNQTREMVGPNPSNE